MCHPGEYSSWHDSYHRTMTRRPAEIAWGSERGPALPVALNDRHFSFLLSRKETEVVARGPDLHVAAQRLHLMNREARGGGSEPPSEAAVRRALEGVPTVQRPIALVTGSHHYLAFWVENGVDRELRQLPFVYHLAEQAWTPRDESFLQPPDSPPYLATWNSNCIQCHAVAGEPREAEWYDEAGLLQVRYRSRVAELGIACEACHGPGRAHADHHRNPLHRITGRAPRGAALVNPAHLSAADGSSICGQCHAYFVPKNEATFWESGYATFFPPRDALSDSRELLSYGATSDETPWLSRELDSIFWPDGTMRVGGREYAGLIESACYLRGSGETQLGCTSCHSMHDSDPNDQLTREAALDPNAPCRSCHEGTSDHSRHTAGSIGTSCVECHMPKTTYALLGAIRSHRIQIPRPEDTSVPSACALCHMDRTVDWLRRHATEGAAAAQASEPGAIGVGVRGALSGNAAERAIYAAALGSPTTRTTIGRGLARALLEQLSGDPYHAVRRIAQRGLGTLPEPPHNATPPLDASVVRKLLSERDQRDVVISE